MWLVLSLPKIQETFNWFWDFSEAFGLFDVKSLFFQGKEGFRLHIHRLADKILFL